MAKPLVFKDQVAIITGASSGIGRAIAVSLSRAGARVVLASRNVTALQALANELKGWGGEALVVRTDVTQDADAENLIGKTLEAWGRMDILIANSGLYVRGPITSLTQADFAKAMDVNFFGSLRLVLRALPYMLKQNSGHIVLMNSLDGRRGLPTDAPYVAAKHALSGFADVLRQDLRGTGLHVTSVYPGRVDTPMIANLRVPRISAKIPAEAVARATVRGILRNEVQVIVPIEGLGLMYLHLLPTSWADWLVHIFHLEGWEQHSRET